MANGGHCRHDFDVRARSIGTLGLLLLCTVLAAGSDAVAQPSPGAANLDFEQGLAGWTKSGDAFDAQPVFGDGASATDFARVPLGGDYWKGVPYPVGHHGQRWIGTSIKRPSAQTPIGTTQGDAPTGTLTSAEIVLSTDSRYFSLLVGGGDDLASLRVELQVFAANEAEAKALEQLRASKGKIAAPLPRDGSFVPLLAATGNGREDLVPRSFAIPEEVSGKRARVRIVDASERGHVNVDYVRFTPKEAAPFFGEVWGLADYHTHPMAHQSFGGLQQIRTVWGVPGTRAADYAANARLFERDLPLCDAAHQGGRVAPWTVNAFENRMPGQDLVTLLGNATGAHTRDHDMHGGSKHGAFSAWPAFDAGAHHQYHVTQLRRAFDGGLRLVSALAVHSNGGEYMMARAEDAGPGKHDIHLTRDLDVIKAHVCGMRQLARLNSDWMEIAYSPDEARRIIHAGKLAVILGVEVDQIDAIAATPEDAVQLLFDLGVRQVTPIHAIKNSLGSPAVFEDLYNTATDFANRKENVRFFEYETASGADKSFFQDRKSWAFYSVDSSAGCGKGKPRGECVLFRLKENQLRAIIGTSRAVWVNDSHMEPHPWKDVAEKVYPKSAAVTGHVNAEGLTDHGGRFLAAMMKRGMLVDIAHMSDKSAERAIAEARARSKYPLMISHAGFRDLMFQKDYSDFGEELSKACAMPITPACVSALDLLKKKGLLENGKIKVPGTITRGFLPKEFDVPTWQARAIGELGGVIGAFVAQDPIDPSAIDALGFEEDCTMSSKGFAAALKRGRKDVPLGVGLATDFGLHATVAPRFGAKACSSYIKAGGPDEGYLRALEQAVNPGSYRFDAQRDGVRYEGEPEKSNVRYGNNAPLKPYRMGTRTFDVNVDGMANFGLLPDFLQDVKNATHGAVDVAPLFATAESYLRMWEKSWQASGCTEATCSAPPKALDCEKACNGTCPDSWNAGAPLHMLDSTIDRCGQPIVRVLTGTPVEGTRELKGEVRSLLMSVPTRNVRWTCGSASNEEVTRCPAGTNFVRMRRGVDRALYTDCLTSDIAQAPAVAGDPNVMAGAVLLANKTDRCRRPVVRMVSGERVSGPEKLTTKSEVDVLRVFSPNVYWACEDGGDSSEERTICPDPTNLVRVQRGDDGLLRVDCMKK